MKILVLGVSGMLGHKVFEVLSQEKDLEVWGTVTDFTKYAKFFPKEYHQKVITSVFADKIETVAEVVKKIRPDQIINCIGIIKQNEKSHDNALMIQLNALFPQQLAKIAEKINARVITIATDCVFDGQKGEAYKESDPPTSYDVYGMSKYLGELHDGEHLTLRTSIIGHELNTNLSLLDWFLNDTRKEIPGYTNAIFSGLTTLELSSFVVKYVLPDRSLKGLYHLSVDAISKHDLLKVVAREYGKDVVLVPDAKLKINRALNSDKLRTITGYEVPTWDELISHMHEDYNRSPFYIIKRKQYGY